MGYLKGKGAVAIARQFGRKVRNFKGENVWARGFFVSTVGLDEGMIREYIRTQEEREQYFDQMSLLGPLAALAAHPTPLSGAHP